MAQEKKEMVKPRPVTTVERLKAKFEKVSSWVSGLDYEISAPRHRNIISGVDGALHLIDKALEELEMKRIGLEPFLDGSEMSELKNRLANAGVSETLPKADPRLMEVKASEKTATADNPVSDEVAIGRIRQDMLTSFRAELRELRAILPSIKAKELAEMRSLVQERRELSGLRKSLGNPLRDRSAGAKAAFERMAKGDPDPKWVWHGNVK